MESRLIGKVVSRRFRVEDIIGSGGMAIVYRAFDLKTHQIIALKVLREEFENDEEYKERFQREAEALRRLNHPNIVNLIDAGSVGGVRYIALEYVDGQTLKDIIKNKGPLPQEEAVRFALQILAALGHAHNRKIIHRDVKPQNIMVTRNGQLKVGDFGIAGIADTKTLTGDGSVIGSVHYFSPEQAKGMRATEASDLYSVGVILYEMLTGHVPFQGETAVSIAMMHLMKEPIPVQEEADVSPALAKIVKKALEKQPADRYQNAEMMTRDLRRGLRHPDGLFMSSGKNERSFPVLVFIVIAAVLISVGFSGLQLYRTLFLMVSVPDLSGLNAADAERMLSGYRLVLSPVWDHDDDVPEGCVIRQDPAPGANVHKDTSITVYLSRGSGLIQVPKVTGVSAEEAEKLLAEAGLRLGRTDEHTSEMIRGMVISQEPEAGLQVQKNAAIDLVVSIGRVIVPELTGLREEEALQRLEQVGLSIGEISSEDIKAPTQDGYVLEQSLPQFMDAAPGQVINLKVGRYRLWDKSFQLETEVDVPAKGCMIRITLVDDSVENEMYLARHEKEGKDTIRVNLRSETSGSKKWRLYIDGNLKEEHEITIL